MHHTTLMVVFTGIENFHGFGRVTRAGGCVIFAFLRKLHLRRAAQETTSSQKILSPRGVLAPMMSLVAWAQEE